MSLESSYCCRRLYGRSNRAAYTAISRSRHIQLHNELSVDTARISRGFVSFFMMARLPILHSRLYIRTDAVDSALESTNISEQNGVNFIHTLRYPSSHVESNEIRQRRVDALMVLYTVQTKTFVFCRLYITFWPKPSYRGRFMASGGPGVVVKLLPSTNPQMLTHRVRKKESTVLYV